MPLRMCWMSMILSLKKLKIKQYKDIPNLSIITHPMTNPLEHIAFEKIDDEFVYGKYGDFTVIMMKRNGYINATRMCDHISEQTGSMKPFRHWRQNLNTAELTNSVAAYGGIQPDALFIKKQGGDVRNIENKDIFGTYVHPDLIPHIACWASPKFAVKVSNIVNKYFNQKELRKKERLINKQKCEIAEQKCEIKDLMKKLDEQHEEMVKRDEISQAKLDKVLHKNRKISHRLKTVKEQNTELLDKIDMITEDRVVNPVDDRDKHEFIIMKDNDRKASRSRKYYVIRTKRRTANSAVERYQKKHPQASILMEIEYNPNSINLWDRVKSSLGKKLNVRTNDFGICGHYTEEKMIEDIHKLNEEKYHIE